MSNAVTATLCAHAGATKISRGELLHIPTPPRTRTFMPVPHADLINNIETRLAEHGITIAADQYAVQNSKELVGSKLFAAFTLKYQTHDDYAFALALRTSNDKSMAIEIVAGFRVFVCDNMALSGESTLLCRKHTSLLNPRVATYSAIDKAISRFTMIDQRVAALKETTVSDDRAQAVILQAYLKGVMPNSLIKAVNDEYFTPTYEDFAPGTAWSLHNAFTTVFGRERQDKPHLLLDSTQALGTLFQI